MAVRNHTAKWLWHKECPALVGAEVALTVRDKAVAAMSLLPSYYPLRHTVIDFLKFDKKPSPLVLLPDYILPGRASKEKLRVL